MPSSTNNSKELKGTIMEIKDYFKLNEFKEDDFDYEYGIIDANYILFRNKGQMAGDCYPNPIKYEDLLLRTLQSFMKLKREHNFRYPILVWDSSPYHKVTAIENYKADRYIPTDEMHDELELSKEGKTPEEIAQIEEDQKVIRLDQENFATASTIKYGFVSAYEGTGFTSMIKKGYEADDLAYMLAKQLESHNKKSILLTADKDWLWFTNPNVDFMSTHTHHSYPKLEAMWDYDKEEVAKKYKELYDEDCTITRYEYGILLEISGISHNNAGIFTHPEYNWFEFAARLLHKDNTLPDYDITRAAFEAMNMEIGVVPRILDDEGNLTNESSAGTPYMSDALNLVKFKLKDHKFKVGHFEDKMNKEFIKVNFSTYADFTKGLDRVVNMELK